MELPIADRKTAGRALAEKLQSYKDRDDVIVLAMPRGGVPVAWEISRAIRAPLDLMLVRKIGTPGQEELAMGAIAAGNIRVLIPEVIGPLRISEEAIEEVSAREKQELERRQKAYRGDRPLPDLKNKIVILVDDGIATGATMKAAIEALKLQHPAKVIAAVPVGPQDTIEQLSQLADEVICPATPEPFTAIGRWYLDFTQLDDEEVRSYLKKAWS